MNPLSKVTGTITLPIRVAGAVAGPALGLVGSGVRTSTRVLGWAVAQARGGTSTGGRPTLTSEGPGAAAVVPGEDTSSTFRAPVETPVPAPASGTPRPAGAVPTEKPVPTSPSAPLPAPKATARKRSAKKAPVKKAPSAKAATAGPAVARARRSTGTARPSEAPTRVAGEQDAPKEPLVDPSLAKAVRSESDVLRKAADPDKG